MCWLLLASERGERDTLSRSSMENAIRIYIYIYIRETRIYVVRETRIYVVRETHFCGAVLE